jgi:Na+-translocating ferredoxin:NAD+ oxidoreductase subunit D
MNTAAALRSTNSSAWMMQQVVLATLPGIAALSWWFGPGTLLNIAWAAIFALGAEAAVLRARGRAALATLRDSSALVTAVLLGIALPPAAPWWLIACASVFAIVIAKHLYGGLGRNPFNPAMAGYVLVLVSFPLQMTRWPAPLDAAATGQAVMGITSALQSSLGLLDATRLDALTGATALDLLRRNDALLISELRQSSTAFGTWGGAGWEWVNGAFLLGGLGLLARRVCSWHGPLGMLLGLFVMAALFHDGGSAASGGSPLFHFFSGATLFAAFFIVTDPVSAPASRRGQLLAGMLIGALVYIIRHWGSYPDGVAFAVLLANFATPLLDHYLQPRVYGHGRGGSD